MLRLTTFGGVTLSEDGRPASGAATGRRRLALLVVLAAAGDRGIGRDALAGLLWPDSPPEHARHSLEQTLYATRRALRCEQLVLGPTTLSLNPACITTDVGEFEAALRNAQLERAVALYHGPFADGLSTDGSGELERRVDAARVRYAREYVGALEALARAAGARGDHAACVRWWRRLADAEPLNARAATAVVEALVAAGEHAQALHFALLYEALVRHELDTPPAPEIAGWILRLRGVPNARPAAPSAGAPPPGAAAPAHAPPADRAAEQEQRRMARLGRALGRRYRVDRLVSEDTVAATYAAATVDGAPAREVEVHVLRSAVAATATPERFRDALRRITALADPHILPTLDYGAAEELFYYVTARRLPTTLRDRLRRERELPVADALRLARDVAAALAHAHARGVCHGDLRPKHVMLTTLPEGAVVSSFGILEAVSPDPASGTRTTVVALTLGSPAYLSPEQLAGGGAGDARSDVYALGCILYEMLAGEPPFGRRRTAVLARELAQPAPPLRAVRERVPTALDEVVQTCLARVPADRYPSGEEVARALAAVRPPPGA